MNKQQKHIMMILNGTTSELKELRDLLNTCQPTSVRAVKTKNEFRQAVDEAINDAEFEEEKNFVFSTEEDF